MLAKLSAHPSCVSLGLLIGENGFGVLPPGNSYLEEGGVRFLRATELGPENTIDWDACLRAPAEFAKHDRATLKIGDVLIAVKGATIASEKSICTVTELSEHTIINGSIFRFQPVGDTSTAFLLEVLSSGFMRQQMKGALVQNNAVDYLSKGVIESLLFPLPRRRDQEKLVAAMDAARAERRAKLAEADALLAGLDGFLLATLGLTPPPKDDRKVFAARRADAQRQGHLNADYFHPERILALRAMERETQRLTCQPLAAVVSFIRDQIKTPGPNYLSLAHVQSHTGERIAAAEEAAGACSTFAPNDVLFARLRPYLNKVWRAESAGCCSPEFHVLRAKNSNALRPDYLAAILRSSLILAQTRHMMTGNTHPRLTNEDVVNLVIPIPKPAVQETIAIEARRRREAARRLRTEAETGWQTAKRWFEEQLLGGVK